MLVTSVLLHAGPGAESTVPAPHTATSPAALQYRQLTERHPQYDLEYWTELRALYEGGKRLLRDPGLFQRLFHKHEGESESSYQERTRRAFYVNHLAAVIDFTVAGLAQDKPVPVPPSATDGEPVELDDFYGDFVSDVTPAGARAQTFAALLLEGLRTASLLGRAYILCDMAPAARAFDSLADQQEAGALDVYACELAPESIVDWEIDGDGSFKWALHHKVEQRRDQITDDRKALTRHTYTLYTPTAWARYVVDIRKDQQEPSPEFVVEPESVGRHSFGRVPIVRVEMPPGLWAGNKVFSLAVEYLNKSCGLSWAEYRSLYQQLYEFLAPEHPGVDTPIAANQQDPHRAKRNKRGPGYVQVRGDQDKAMFVGPDTSGFTHGLASLSQIRDDIYRVTYQMALGQDTNGATIRRAAESKERDAVATEIVLGAMGEIVRDAGRQTMDLVATGRREETGWTCTGLARFDVQDIDSLIAQSVALESISIPSATFQVLHKTQVAVARLGDAATPDVTKKITDELTGVITQDQFSMVPQATGIAEDEEDPPPGDEHDDKPPAGNPPP